METKVVTAPSSGGNSKLYELLTSDDLTSEILEEFSQSPEGLASWATMTNISEYLLNPPILSIIRKCPSVYLTMGSTSLDVDIFAPWDFDNFVGTEFVADIVKMTGAELTEWINTATNTNRLMYLLITPSSLNQVLANTELMYALLSNDITINMILEYPKVKGAFLRNPQIPPSVTAHHGTLTYIMNSDLGMDFISMAGCIQLISQDTTLIDIIMETWVARENTWNAGKDVADELLRTSVIAKTHLRDSYSKIVININGHTMNFGKKSYLIDQTAKYSHGGYDVDVGRFMTDHQPREIMGTTVMKYIPYHERITSLYLRNRATSSSYDLTYTYIEMQDPS